MLGGLIYSGEDILALEALEEQSQRQHARLVVMKSECFLPRYLVLRKARTRREAGKKRKDLSFLFPSFISLY